MAAATAPTLRSRTRSVRLGVCAYAGLAAGIATGLVLTLLDLTDGPLEDGRIDILVLWAILAAFGWLVIVGLFTVFVRYQLASVAVPAFVNSALTTGLMVAVCQITGLFEIAWLIGFLAGLLVGQMLCTLFRLLAAGSTEQKA